MGDLYNKDTDWVIAETEDGDFPVGGIWETWEKWEVEGSGEFWKVIAFHAPSYFI